MPSAQTTSAAVATPPTPFRCAADAATLQRVGGPLRPSATSSLQASGAAHLVNVGWTLRMARVVRASKTVFIAPALQLAYDC